jgi:hypothetical protein
MQVARKITIVGNPKHKRRRNIARSKPRKKRRSSGSKGNPAYLMLLGPANPKRSSTVTKKRKKKNRAAGSHHHRVVARSRNKKAPRRAISKAQVRAYMKRHRMGGRRRHSSNPFAKSISLSGPTNVVTSIGGVLAGVFINKTVVAFLPANITSNTLYATLASGAIALAEWWIFSMVEPEFGAAVGLGALAEVGSIALSNYLPQIGVSPLSGRLGDFVPGRFVVPQNPVLDAATGFPKSMTMATSAYPRPYAVA